MSTGRRELCEWVRRSNLRWFEMATRLEISAAYMSQIKTGERRPGLELLVKISDVTGISPRSWADKSMSSAGKEKISKQTSALLATS